MSANRVQEQTTLSGAVQVFDWNKRLMSPLGLLPMQRNNLLFFLTSGYFFSCMLLEYLDLLLAVDDLEHVVRNLTESITYTQILAKFITLWFFNHQLGQLMTESMQDLDMKNYNAIEETKAFIVYNQKSKVFVKILAIFTAITASSYYFMPLLAVMGQHGLPETSGNASEICYLLPYQFRIFYRIENLQSYMIFYAVEFPFLFISYFAPTAVDSLMVSLVFHICGQMAVLALRINNINTDPCECAEELKSVVKNHMRLLRMGQTVKETFSATLLIQLVTTTILLCVLDYQILTNFANGEVPVLASFIVYQITMLLILYAQCTVGEGFLTELDLYAFSLLVITALQSISLQLISYITREVLRGALFLNSLEHRILKKLATQVAQRFFKSTKVCEAFYSCKWYNMPSKHAKYIVLCMARSQEPLTLSAGKFGTFCLTTFTDTVKTSVAYLSVLRSFL